MTGESGQPGQPGSLPLGPDVSVGDIGARVRSLSDEADTAAVGGPGPSTAAAVASSVGATADLIANRAGAISARQRADLAQTARMHLVMLLAGGVLTVAFGLAFFGLPVPSSGGPGVVPAMLTLVIAVGLIVRGVWDPILADLRAGRVASVSGQADIGSPIYTRSGVQGHAVHVAGRRFIVGAAVYRHLDPARPVTLYYLPRSRAVLSAEPAPVITRGGP